MLSLLKHNNKIDWFSVPETDIVNANNEDGIRFLELFLRDYKSLTGKTKVNATCPSCILSYIRDYKSNFNTIMENNVNKKLGFQVKKKYLGAPLGFGTGKFIQDEYPDEATVAKILERHEPDKVFQKVPKNFNKEDYLTTKKEIKTTNSEKPKSWQAKVKEIANLETVEEVSAYIVDETSAKVIEAGKKRIDQLNS